jgi:hypothetical protein
MNGGQYGSLPVGSNGVPQQPGGGASNAHANNNNNNNVYANASTASTLFTGNANPNRAFYVA